MRRPLSGCGRTGRDGTGGLTDCCRYAVSLKPDISLHETNAMRRIITGLLCIYSVLSHATQINNYQPVSSSAVPWTSDGQTWEASYRCFVSHPVNVTIHIFGYHNAEYTAPNARCDGKEHDIGYTASDTSGTVTVTGTPIPDDADVDSDIIWGVGGVRNGTKDWDVQGELHVQRKGCHADVRNVDTTIQSSEHIETTAIVANATAGARITVSPTTHDASGGYLVSDAHHLKYSVNGTYKEGTYTLPPGSTEASLTIEPTSRQTVGKYTGTAVVAITCE